MSDTDGIAPDQRDVRWLRQGVAFSHNFAHSKPTIGAAERRHILGLCALLSGAADEIDRLRAFAAAVLADWPTDVPDPEAIESAAVRAGILTTQVRKVPCREGCACGEFTALGETTTCYTMAPEIAAARENAELSGAGRR